MPEYDLRTLETYELRDIYNLIQKDFISGEYPPLEVLKNQIQKGSIEGFIISDGTIDYGYSFCAVSSVHDYVLITLLAVLKEYRGRGIGSVFLKKLNTVYAHRQAIVIEVERPEDALTVAERDKRLRRIVFYEKAGYRLIKGISYVIWGIPMHLMVLPINASIGYINKEIEQIMQQIYLGLAGKQFINKLQIKRVPLEKHTCNPPNRCERGDVRNNGG